MNRLQPSDATPATICTIVAKNYLAYARTLAESFFAHHPDGQMFVLLIDRPDGCFDPVAEPFTVLLAEDLPIVNFSQMALRYSVLELSTAVKPFLLEHLFTQYNLAHVIFLDPDIYCYRPLTPLLDALRTHFIALTPHLLDPIEADQRMPSDLHILQAGAYNLGCIGVARGAQLERFLRWWQRCLERDCLVDLSRGLFVDQRWIDLVPSLFADVAIVRDPGCNVAYWNLSNRQICSGVDGYTVNGAPLTFFHFSGVSEEYLERISVHQDRYTLDDLPHLRPLFRHYRERLIENGIALTRRWPYGYATFDNGVRIPAIARQIWRNNDGEHRWPAPFTTRSSQSFFAWLNAEAHPAPGAGLLTNLALAIYQQRPDVRAAFPDITGAHRRPFLNWFVHDVEWQHQIDPAFVEPVRQSLAQIDAALPQPLPVPPPLVVSSPPMLPTTPMLRRKLYYAVRNPLRRIGLHEHAKRILGRSLAVRVYDYFLGQDARSASFPMVVDPATVARIDYHTGLNVVGYLEHPTGVGEVARSILHAIRQSNYPVCGVDIIRQAHAGTDTDGWRYRHNLLCVNADSLPGVRQALGKTFFEGRPTVGFWHWETAHFPQEWIDRFTMLDELWVASAFVHDTLAPLASIPVLTMPVPVVAPVGRAGRRAALGLPEDRFIWLFVFDMQSVMERKNPLAAIAAFRAAFGDRSTQAHLVIKVNSGDEYPAAIAELRTALASVSGTLIERTMQRNELNDLFAACDGYLSLHRSEGFGLTMAETLALGKPVVATGYSGNMQFMTEQNSFPVRYRLVEIDRAYGPYPPGHYWAEPDVLHAAECMTHVLADPPRALQRARIGAADVQRRFAPDVVARCMIDRLGHVSVS